MLIVVKDACLLIDLAEVGLLTAWSRLGIPTHTTDMVLAEVSHAQQQKQIAALVAVGAIQTHSLEAAQLLEAVGLFQTGGISLPDASAVVLARQLNATLLTGDRKLRRTAEQHHIETHGMLWVLNYMVEHGVLRGKDAATHLRTLCKRGSRYPKHECEVLIKGWMATEAAAGEY